MLYGIRLKKTTKSGSPAKLKSLFGKGFSGKGFITIVTLGIFIVGMLSYPLSSAFAQDRNKSIAQKKQFLYQMYASNSSDIISEKEIKRFVTAAEYGDIKTVKSLLVKGVDVDTRDDRGDTALMWASYNGQLKIVKLLLKKGADVNERDRKGRTALMMAAEKKHFKIVRLLLVKGADVKAKDNKGYTALIWAVNEQHLFITKLLLDNRADVDAMDAKGRTALMVATLIGGTAIMEILLASGADVNVKDAKGRTALDHAKSRDRLYVIKAA